jgi:sulfite reductase alpha subunit-like flavoprotein
LTYYVYLTSIARKKFIKGLSIYAKDEKEKKELELLSSNSEEGKKAYNAEIKELCLDPLDVLLKFPSVELPFGLFLELLPKLQPRYYSIASSSETNPDSIHAVVAVVTYEGKEGKKMKGICSNFLKQISEGNSSYIYVRQSNFHLPENSYKPVILVGPGTGLAPFRFVFQFL